MAKMFIESKNIEWENVGEGVRRKIMTYDDNLMLVRIEFEKGAIGPLHQHYHTQVSQLESGVFEIQIDGTKQVLKAGDVFHVPPNLEHGVVCLEKGVLVDIFNPYREDFVKAKKS